MKKRTKIIIIEAVLICVVFICFLVIRTIIVKPTGEKLAVCGTYSSAYVINYDGKIIYEDGKIFSYSDYRHNKLKFTGKKVSKKNLNKIKDLIDQVEDGTRGSTQNTGGLTWGCGSGTGYEMLVYKNGKTVILYKYNDIGSSNTYTYNTSDCADELTTLLEKYIGD